MTEGYSLPDKVKMSVSTEREALERIGRNVEVIGLLYNAGLSNVAMDLAESLRRFYMSDYEGTIKFARKVVEGMKKLVEEGKVSIASENRLKLLHDYLSKAYQLISNFGEHSGTYGFMPEAILSKDIALSACRYVISYLESL